MGDTLQDAINALRLFGKEDEAKVVEELRGRQSETMREYHASQRASYEAGRASALSEEAQPVAPEGWKLVPVEPTDDMLWASINAPWEDDFSDPELARSEWIAMLKAAPVPAPAAREASSEPTWLDTQAKSKEMMEKAFRDFEKLVVALASGEAPSGEKNEG